MLSPAYAEVDLSAIRHNVAAVRERVGQNVRVMPAVKANAYGHGAPEVSRACLDAGADALCVASVNEALELREAGVDASLLILGCSLPEAAEEIVRLRCAATVCDLRFARALSDAACAKGAAALAHVKVDTGMGRIGVRPEETVEFIREISHLPGLQVAGLFTHFPCSDEPGDEFTATQVRTIEELRGQLQLTGLPMPMVHASNSGAILAHPDADFDAVRPGIMVYGHYPSPEVAHTIAVAEALTLKTRIVFIKHAPAGTTVSYGRTVTLSRPSIIATLPIGYGDGYNRLNSNSGEAALRGQRVSVVGRVCMDQVMIDVTDVPGAQVGDEVVLYGGGFDYLSVSHIARRLGTIPYEVLCNIGPRVERVYLP